MVFLPLILSLAVAPFALAQTNTNQANNTALQIEAIEAHFNNSGIVPSLLTAFDPSAVFTLSYTGVGDIAPGQLLTKERKYPFFSFSGPTSSHISPEVAPTPQLLVTPANSSVSLTGSFTLAMVDAGPVGTDESQGQTRHWLVNNVILSGQFFFFLSILESLTAFINLPTFLLGSPLNVPTSGGLAVTEYAGPAPPQGSGAHR